MIMTSDARPNIFSRNHRHLAGAVRCWIDPTDIMFLRSLHGHNDGDRTIPPNAVAVPPASAKALCRDRFGLSPRGLKRLAHNGIGQQT